MLTRIQEFIKRRLKEELGSSITEQSVAKLLEGTGYKLMKNFGQYGIKDASGAYHYITKGGDLNCWKYSDGVLKYCIMDLPEINQVAKLINKTYCEEMLLRGMTEVEVKRTPVEKQQWFIKLKEN